MEKNSEARMKLLAWGAAIVFAIAPALAETPARRSERRAVEGLSVKAGAEG
jgi:hypothetical protein